MTTVSLLSSRSGGNGKPRATPPPIPVCIDLAERFGRHFRVEYEESYYAERHEYREAESVWLRIIPCRAGHICPWGGSTLAAVTDRAGPIARKLSTLPGVTLWQDGSDGATVLFDVADFEAVARIMRPCKRRVLTEKIRAHLEVVGAKTRFKHGVGNAGRPRPCVPTGPADLGAVPTETGLLVAY